MSAGEQSQLLEQAAAGVRTAANWVTAIPIESVWQRP
jgi:hypothetical protein